MKSRSIGGEAADGDELAVALAVLVAFDAGMLGDATTLGAGLGVGAGADSTWLGAEGCFAAAGGGASNSSSKESDVLSGLCGSSSDNVLCVGIAGVATGAGDAVSTGRASKSSSESGVSGSSIDEGAVPADAARATGGGGGVITGSGAIAGASGADVSGDAAATRATSAAIAPLLLVPVVDVDGDAPVTPCARAEVAADELAASGAEAVERPDVEALIDELPGAVGRGGAFAAGGGDAAGAGRAGGIVGIAALGIGLAAVAVRALVLLLGAATGLEGNGFLTAVEAVGCDMDGDDGVAPAGNVGCLPVEDAGCGVAGDAVEVGFVAAAGRAADAAAAVALAGRAVGADELARAVGAGAGEPAGAADDLEAVVLGWVLAPVRPDVPMLDWADAAEPVATGDAASGEAGAALVRLRVPVLAVADAVSAEAGDVDSTAGVAAGFRAADAGLEEEALPSADTLLGAGMPAVAGDPADGVAVEDGGGGGGAIQMPDSDASSVGCAGDPDVDPVLTGATGEGREPESEVVRAGLEPESDVPADARDDESGFAVDLGIAVAGFVGGPPTGGIPKPAGEVGFDGAGAPPLAESVSNDPSGSNN